jgi:arginyl-tRNA--protein-N-Asp/Glu arginylyltransferase
VVVAQNDLPANTLQLYLTEPHRCGYLPDQTARTEVALPWDRIGADTYARLLRLGFRRSGVITYRPNCDQCRACVSVRVPTAEFRATRSQRRALANHAGLQATATALSFQSEHYALFRRYEASRHSGREMDRDDREQYSSFLLESLVHTHLIEFRDNGALVMVSVIDETPDGLSSVYTFFDPDIPGASLGTYSILWQIEQCRRASLPYVYLGYWIKESRKMSYKARFRPIEGFVAGRWRRLDADELGN